MGVYEDLMGKMDALIASQTELTAELRIYNAGKGATTDGATGDTAPKPRGRPKKEESAGPTHTEAELVALFDKLKGDGSDSAMTAKLKKVIADCGFTKLVELRQAPAKFDEAYAMLEKLDVPAEDDDL